MTNKNSKFHDTLLYAAFSILVLLLLYAFVVFIGWLMLHPLPPAVKAESLSASGFGPSNTGYGSAATAAKYDFHINITNPNKKIDMWIHPFSLRMVYRDMCVSRVVLDPYEGIWILRNMDSEVGFQMNMTKLSDNKKRKKIARDMSRDRSRGAISFDVMTDIRVTFRSGKFLPSKQQLLKVACKDLNIMFSSPKDNSGSLKEGKDCLVNHT